MAVRWQMGACFAAGLVLGGAVGAWAVTAWQDEEAPAPPPAVQPAPVAVRPVVHASAAPAAERVPAEAPAEVLPGPHACAYLPVVEPAKGDDGQEALQPPPAAPSESEVAGLLLTGKEALASGRQRDAEVDFLNACHEAERLPASNGMPLADAEYQLARHYGNLVIGGARHRAELHRRAEELYTASLQAYRGYYGERHERTRFAREGLAALEQAMTAPAPKPHAKLRHRGHGRS